MIAEYHLTSSARVSSTLCPVLLEASKLLLPAIKSYLPGISFEGTRDVRVLDRAKTLQVAVWLHQLDMSVGGYKLASKTLEALWHSLGPLLESFLAPTTNDLTFWEVIKQVLHKNWRDAQHRLGDLVMHHTQICQELDNLTEAHREASGSSRKRIKKEIDMRCKDLESLKERISQQESHLQQDTPEQDVPKSDDLLNQGAEAKMATAPGADDAPSKSASAPVSNSPHSEDHAMDVDKGAVGPPPTSPVSHKDDNLLNGNDAVGVEAGLAHLTVSSPSGQDGEGEEASITEVPPPLVEH